MDLRRLLHPRSVAVVGATPRPDTYAHQTLANLDVLGYPGAVYGVNPRYDEVRGRPCLPSLADLPEPPDAVVIGIPATGVPAAVEAAGAAGAGGAVVIAAGFAEAAAGTAGGLELQAEVRAAALRHDLPVCGPNCNGIVQLHERAALWGDALLPREAGPVAVVSQSGNVAVNALAARRGLRLHTVVSCGNQAVLDAAGFLEALGGEDGLRSVALFLEDDGDGERMCEALARCAEAGVGVAVLKVGASAAGSSAAAAHTGSLAGDQRVFRALVEEAGAAWARDVHELLELAKALAVPSRPRGPGLAILTCSGGDSGVGADEAERLGLALPPFTEPTRARLAKLLPATATLANPLDYTALVWGEVETLRDAIAAVGADPAVDEVLVFYDQPHDLAGASGASWTAVREGIRQGAAASPVPTMVASTLPELLEDEAAAGFQATGIPAIAGLSTGLACALARQRPAGDPARLRAVGAAVRALHAPTAGPWLAEHEAKALLRAHRLAVVPGRTARDAEDAVAAARDVGLPVALKRSADTLRHKSDSGGLALGLDGEDAVREAFARLVASNGTTPGDAAAAGAARAAILVERMAGPGVELLVAARGDAVVPALVVGLGGLWTELLADVAVVPLPAGPARVEAAIRSLRGAPLLTGGRGGTPLDIAAAARLAVAAGELLLRERLVLLELNPVIVCRDGAVAVDATARLGAS